MMEVAAMGPDDDKPIFHDFLSMTRGGSLSAPAPPMRGGSWPWEALASAGASSGACGTPDPGSERRGVTNSEVFRFHGRKTAIPEPEVGNTFSGRKRNNSESANHLDAMRDKKLLTGSDYLERSNLTKLFGKKIGAEQSGRSLNDEITFSMQPQQRPTPVIIRPRTGHWPDSSVLRCERSMPANSGQTAHYPVQLLPTGMYKSAITVPQSATDEGSRTGTKGSGILKIINPGSGGGERHMTGSFPSLGGPMAAHMRESASNSASRHGIASIGRQMTIFYAGQAHVFDNVHPNKADVIMALAGSSGGSWSTTYSPKPESRPSAGEVRIPGSKDDMRTSNLMASTRGLPGPDLREAALIKDASGPQSQIPGVFQGSLVDPRPTEPAVEPQLDS